VDFGDMNMLIWEYNKLKKNCKTIKRLLKNLNGATLQTRNGILCYDKEKGEWYLIRWNAGNVLTSNYYDDELPNALEMLYRWEVE
jgi:hypothetical protein